MNSRPINVELVGGPLDGQTMMVNGRPAELLLPELDKPRARVAAAGEAVPEVLHVYRRGEERSVYTRYDYCPPERRREAVPA